MILTESQKYKPCRSGIFRLYSNVYIVMNVTLFPRMHRSLLLLLAAGTLAACVALTSTLHGFRGCAVREFSFVAHKPGCKGLRVTTEACWGRCHTWEVPTTHPSASRAGSLGGGVGVGGAMMNDPGLDPNHRKADDHPWTRTHTYLRNAGVGGGGCRRPSAELAPVRSGSNFTAA